MGILDSRDLEEELNELLEAKENKEEYDKDRLRALENLKSECEGYGWEYGIIFIPEYEWEDYCREFAEDVGYLGTMRDNENPLQYCIDWEQWAETMSQDYSIVNFEDEDYYYREA